MHLPSADFVEFATGLEVGQRVRVNHHCGEGSTLMVSRVPSGVSAYCFRCNLSGFSPVQRPLAERIAELTTARAAENEARSTITLPMPAEYDPQLWPAKARVWLYKAGLSNDAIMQEGMYYNAKLMRVVMPVKQDGKLVYWQARGFDSALPKYINPVVDRSTVAPTYGDGEVHVLTEDILSAWKVGRVTKATSLMGVRMNDTLLSQLVADRKPIIVALDPDPPGIAGAQQVAKRCKMVGLRTEIVVARLDPKFLSRSEIESWIC